MILQFHKSIAQTFANMSQILQMIMTKLYYRIYKSIPAQQGVLKQLLHCSRLCHRYLEHHDYHKYTQ